MLGLLRRQLPGILGALMVVLTGCEEGDLDAPAPPLPADAEFQTITPPTTVQYEGQTLNPICMDSSPYAFFAKRGSINKLLMYYQGGGACWDPLTCGIPVCDANVVTTLGAPGSDNPNRQLSGFADLDNPANPFKDWHIVIVSYCSCDVHFGDDAQDYTETLHVEHRGYDNARVAEKYARENFPDPDEVFVTGSSAGAYGAWFHAPLLQRAYPDAHFNVLADAGNGVITAEFRELYFPNWNFEANLPDDIPGLREVFDTGGGIPEYTEVVANYFPDTRWAHYSTGFDGGQGGQSSFYNIMLNDNQTAFGALWWQASCPFFNEMRSQALWTYDAVPDNYRYYIGTGSRHTAWGSNKVYTDTTGGVPTLVDWVNAMLDGSDAWENVECTNCGLLLEGDPRPNPLQAPFEQVGSDVVINCAAP